ncbi:MAG: SDR family oxidoreductase [Rhodospirillales bacterium]|nr:SDR family oxidoreductase [Rhodospirillales bacterium]MDH3909736.1 SDR family oxidoreductase [Rhodospirillales bacterium]MDH3965538.1 SDR family oxidoreductase [Rhodospirillales bacterium]
MEKVMVVTGGSRGIGASIARYAGRAGYKVCVNYREQAGQAAEVVAAIEGEGGRAQAFQADVSVEADVVRLFAEVDEALGPVTALANNAGIMQVALVEDMRAEDLNRLWATNITSAFLCAREAIRRMSTKHGGTGGAIANLSSIAGKKGGRGQRVHYAASKGALNTMTIGLATEVAGEGIRVNAVLPGLIDTDMHGPWGGKKRIETIGPTIPLGRAGVPDDVAAAVVWLMSDDASFITGELLEVGGGS